MPFLVSPPEVNPVEQHSQLLARDDPDLCGILGPREAVFFQPLLPQAKPVAVPVQNLQPIPVWSREQVQASIKRIMAKLIAYQGSKSIDLFAHVRRPGPHKHPELAPVADHSEPSTFATRPRCSMGHVNGASNRIPFARWIFSTAPEATNDVTSTMLPVSTGLSPANRRRQFPSEPTETPNSAAAAKFVSPRAFCTSRIWRQSSAVLRVRFIGFLLTEKPTSRHKMGRFDGYLA